MYRTIIILFSLLNVYQANASQEQDISAIQLSVAAGNVSEQRQLIETKITKIEYKEMKNEDRIELLSQLEAIDNGEISEDTIVVYQNNVNNILKLAFANSKMVCTREKLTGSNMPTRTCMTVAAKTRQHEKLQQTRNTGAGPSASTASQ